MLRRFDDALRAAAERVAGVDRDVRRKLVRVTGREERYSEKFVTLLDERMSGFEEGGVRWKAATHISDKQSGQEQRTGADLFISFELDFDGFSVQKGVQVQAKVNHAVRHGMSIHDHPRLRRQCEAMIENTDESFVFVYGQDGTRVLKAGAVLDIPARSFTALVTQSTSEFFYDFFVCRFGDRDLHADSEAELQDIVEALEARAGIVLTGTEVR